MAATQYRVSFSGTVTRRDRKRRLKSGAVVKQPRFVLNYRKAKTGKRCQLFFSSRADALQRRDEMAVAFANGETTRINLTVAEAVQRWLDDRATEVKGHTLRNYRIVADRHVTGRIGALRVADLTTAQIRQWHREVSLEVSHRTANVAKKHLRAALSLAAEDFNVRVAAMPTKLGRGQPKAKKVLLTLEQVGQLLRAAAQDTEQGLYYAWPFLTGTRPSEQLALRWDEVNFVSDTVRIRRMLERGGVVCEVTKTAAGRRDIPMSPLLRSMLLAWRERCPSSEWVFPSPEGKPFIYWNFRRRYWVRGLLAAGVPLVTPHSARHSFISTLQASGVEVGLVAKLAGHADPSVTLGVYTQAVRPGDAATMRALEAAYAAPTVPDEARRAQPHGSQA